MNGLEIVQGLIQRGYPPHQAAALAGHMLQESGGNPAALNKDEGANGLMQWRGPRWDALQGYAKAQGKDPNDPNVQLDFVGQELAGPEKRAGAGFLAAPDVASASAALKPYIRFGDDSAGARLGNAQSLYSQMNSGPVGALDAAAAPAPVAGPPMQLPSAPAAEAAPAPTLAGALGAAGTQMAGPQQAAAPQQPDFAPLQQIQTGRPNSGQAQQIAAAIAKSYGIG